MKIMIFTDNHFCETSSIVSKYGTLYTMRLENQLASINWVEQLAVDSGCQAVICLGDFFDKSHLTDQEITATKEIAWNNLYHCFLVGNHESGVSSLIFNSAKVLENGKQREVISEAKKTTIGDCELCFLPYVVESDRLALSEYFGSKTGKRIIFSHNDLKGIQMGPVISRVGFDIADIEANCDLFINGHLHNGTKVTDKVINLGSLTGQNFGEDALRYKHNVMILDTDTLSYQLIENPHAFNFYKLDIDTNEDIMKLSHLKNNSVVSIKCKDVLYAEVKELIKNTAKITESRIIVTRDLETAEATLDSADFKINQLDEFVRCCRDKIDNSTILEEELAEICK